MSVPSLYQRSKKLTNDDMNKVDENFDVLSVEIENEINEKV